MVCRARLLIGLVSAYFFALMAQPLHAQEGLLALEASLLMPRASASLLLDIARADDRLVAVGERGHILLSKDGAESWQQVPVPTRQMLTAVHFPSAMRGWAVGHDGIVLSSVDGGASWAQQRDGLVAQDRLNRIKVERLAREEEALKQQVLSADSLEERETLQLELEDAVLDSEDARYALRNSVHAPPLLDVFFSDDLHGVAVGAFNTLLVTSDGGSNWRYIADRLDNLNEYHLNAVTGDGEGSVWLAGEGGLLFRSNDHGEQWQRLDSPYEGSWFGLALSPDSAKLLVFGLRGNVYASTDGGIRWQRRAVNSDRTLSGGLFLNANKVALVGAVGTLLFSTDGGNSFSASAMGGRVNLSAVSFADGQILAVGQGGLHRAPMPQKNQ